MSSGPAIDVSERPPRAVPAARPAALTRLERPTIVVFVLMAVSAVLLLYVGRRLTFFYDEWTFILERRGGGVSTFLDPHNGHLVLFPVIVYKILFALVGLRHYWPYRVVSLALHLLSCWLLFVLVRRRVGPWAALVPTAALLFMGTAWQVLMWPFQISFLTSVAGGLGALSLLDRRGSRRDVGACALLIWSLTGSAAGLGFLVAAAIRIIGQRPPLTRLWVVVVPAVLYGIWYLHWGSSEPVTTNSILTSPQYVADAASGAVAGIVALNAATWGPPLTLGLIALLALSWHRRGGGPPPVMFLAALGGVFTFWILAALVRDQSPDPAASRYLYVGAVFIWLIVAEMVGTVVFRGPWLALVGVLALGVFVSQMGALRGGEGGLRASDDAVRTSFGVVELSTPAVSPAFIPEPVNAPQLSAGAYLAAIHDLGSPARTLPELESSPESVREYGDLAFEHGEQLAVAPATSSSVATSCRTVASADLPVRAGTTLVLGTAPQGHTSVNLRRLGLLYPATPFATITTPARKMIRFPTDRATQLPWHVRVVASAPVSICLS